MQGHSHIEKGELGGFIQHALELGGVSDFTPRLSDRVGDQVGLLVDSSRLFVYFNGKQVSQPSDRLGTVGSPFGNSIIVDGLQEEIPGRFAVSLRDFNVGNRVRIVKVHLCRTQAQMPFECA